MSKRATRAELTRIRVGDGGVLAVVIVTDKVVAKRDLATRAEAAAEERVLVVDAFV